MVPVCTGRRPLCLKGLGTGDVICLPLSGPAHEVVASHEGGKPVENLRLGATESVEDGVMSGAGPGVLTVSGETVVNNALLLGAACVRVSISSS